MHYRSLAVTVAVFFLKFIMKYLIVLLGFMVSLTLGILGIIHSRRTLEIQLNKTNYFENVKNKVTNDMLKESKSNIADANTRLEQVQKRIQELTNEVKTAQQAADGTKTELNTCNNDLVRKGMDQGLGESQIVPGKLLPQPQSTATLEFHLLLNGLGVSIQKKSKTF